MKGSQAQGCYHRGASHPVFLLVLVFTGAPIISGSAFDKVLFCYWAQWSVYRQSPGAFYTTNIDPYLCTHIIYAYVGINSTTNMITSRDPTGDYSLNGKGLIAELVSLKEINPKLKVLVSIGGWSEGSINYSNMAATPSTRKIFIDSVLNYLSVNNFDGLDVAWTYPADRGGILEDKENYVTLLQELREQFKNSDEGRDYLLTVQLSGKRYIIDGGYDVVAISETVDYMSLVAYQYNGPKQRTTGINAPLSSEDYLNAEYSVNYMLKKGAAKDKLLLGFATFGHFYLMDWDVKDDNYFAVPASQTYRGQWSKEEGFIGFNEVCYELTVGEKWAEMWDTNSSTPFAVHDRKLISFDNQRSFREKLKLLSSKDLGGAMVWSLDTDDFKGLCYNQSYPLVNTVRRHFVKTLSPQAGSVNGTVFSHSYG